jgi:hypothetical protein
VQDNLLSHPLLDLPDLGWWHRTDSNAHLREPAEDVLMREYEVDSVGSGDVLTARGRGENRIPLEDTSPRRPLLEEGMAHGRFYVALFRTLYRQFLKTDPDLLGFGVTCIASLGTSAICMDGTCLSS